MKEYDKKTYTEELLETIVYTLKLTRMDRDKLKTHKTLM
jgi:hypothetical protein